VRLPLQCICRMCGSCCVGEQPLNCGVQVRQTWMARCPPSRMIWTSGPARNW
jgi:hypothetical protein